MYENLNRVFTLRVKTLRHSPVITIHAYDNAGFQEPNHNRIDVEVRRNGQVVFPRGQLYCGLTRDYCTDSVHAKELVLSLVAMKPGDTDDEYFADYTPEQLEFAETYGELLEMEKHARYCDPETGDVRS